MTLIHRSITTLLLAGAALLAQAATTVPFEIDMRAEIAAGRFDPARDALGVRGSAAPLSWGRSLPLQPSADLGRYVGSIVFERAPFGGQPVQYKLRIERPGAGADTGWEQGRNHPLQLREGATLPAVQRAFNAPPAELPLSRVGRIERLAPPVVSQHVSPRAVHVWLPPGYASAPQRRYPVLYLHDGQNVFDAASAGAEWQVDETAQRLVESGAVEPMIIVAVDHGDDRFTDYTPTASGLRSETPRGGGAPRYARYLIEELKPAIDARYRTKPEAANTAVGGSSLGGLVTMWLLNHHGDRFGAGLVVSPSVWWDGLFIIRDTQQYVGPGARPRLHPRIWLDMGGQEGGPEALAAARQLRDALVSRGWRSGGDLRYVEDPDAGHDEAAWASRVEGMLRFLYGRGAQ